MDQTQNDALLEACTTGKLDLVKELLAQGINFLNGLAETLKSPEATAQLVDTLVETDAETGQTSLRIPVPDKQTVRHLLDIVGKLFG